MMDAAAWACPLPHGKVFRVGVLIPTGMADLGRRKESIRLYYLLSIPIRFVFQLSDELTPRCICNRLGQLVVAKHIFNRQVFDADSVIAPHQLSRQFVKRVLALVCNVFMLLRHLALCLTAVFAPPLFFGRAAAVSGQVSFLISANTCGWDSSRRRK